MYSLRRGSAQGLDADTVTACLTMLQRAQVRLPESPAEGAALARLMNWMSKFAGVPRELSTAMEAMDDPTTPSPQRELSKPDMGALCASYNSSPNCRARLSRPSLLLDDIDGSSPLQAAAGGSLTCTSPELAAQLDQILEWDAFDVFAVARLSRRRPLQTVAWALLQHFELLDSLQLPADKLRSFLKALEESYNDNPYHNSMHAADVMQNVGVFLHADGLAAQLTQLEVLAMLLAACVHDVKHLGFGNAYMVNTSSDAAITWNDMSVNENMHASTAFQLLRRPEHNFLAGLEAEQYRYLRRTMIGIVLATDMASHAALVSEFSDAVALRGGDLRQWPAENRLLALSMAVHCADLGNPGKCLGLSLNWTARISKEFFLQGDSERKAGLPISSLCDRTSTDVQSTQLSFMESVVAPSFKALAALAPKTMAQALANIETAKAHWRSGAVPWREWLSPSHEDFEPCL